MKGIKLFRKVDPSLNIVRVNGTESAFRKRINLIRFLVLVILVCLGWWGYQTPQPESVRPANVGVQSFSVGWFTSKSTKGCVWAIPSLMVTEWRRVCEQDERKTHLVELDEMQSETSYRLVVVDGLRFKFKGVLPVETRDFNDQEPPMPKPAYGAVRSKEGYLVPGALVYLYPRSEGFSYPVAAKTNIDGNYAVDLGLLTNLKELLIIEVVASAGIWNDMAATTKQTEPLPAITAVLK